MEMEEQVHQEATEKTHTNKRKVRLPEPNALLPRKVRAQYQETDKDGYKLFEVESPAKQELKYSINICSNRWTQQ